MMEGSITEEELAGLVRRTKDANSTFMRGDMDHYLALTRHARRQLLTAASSERHCAHQPADVQCPVGGQDAWVGSRRSSHRP